MLYNRKIKYLDYYENGAKVNAGGFAKLEVRDNTLRIELTVRGLHPTDSFERDIVLQGAEKEETLGQIRIQNGSGQFRYSCDADQEIGDTGISYSELCGIRISIGGTREILCQWDNISDKRRITPPEEHIQKSKSDSRESGVEPDAERHNDKKADTDALAYTESEQPRTSGPEKADRTEVKKEKHKSGESEEKEREDKNRENQDGEGRENKEVKADTAKESEKHEDKEVKADTAKESEKHEDKEVKADTVKKSEKHENEERDYKRPETEEDMNMGAQPELVEMQAQGASVNSDVISPQFSEEPSQTVFQSEGQPQAQAEGNAFTVKENRSDQADAQKAPVKLMEDKWQQLSAIYPHIQPFRDERDYLSLTPSDFVLFPNRFYRAVNNSFLLHGYYNYHHLILARIEHRGEVLYYIGVPGNYFEREKQVAIMFGFESFECETEPAKTGDFGYYMMRTEL